MLCIRRFSLLLALAFLSVLTLSARPLLAANEGQADLDAAVEANLNVDSLEDIEKVVKGCETALEKGLDATNTEFAKKLQSGALTRRATVIASALFNARKQDVRWFEFRRMALNDLEKAIKLDANQPTVLLLTAQLEAVGGDLDKAKKALDGTIDLAKDDVITHAKALVLRAKITDDKDKQLADYNEAAKLAPGDADIVRTRGMFLLLQGKTEEALVDLDAACKLKPDHAETQVARGLTQMLLKRYDDSIATFTKAIELAPQAPVTHMHRARAYAAKKDWKASLVDLDEAINLSASQADSLSPIMLRARVYQEIGETEKAKTDIETAFQPRPESNDPSQLRALLFAGDGELKHGIDDLESLRKLAPKNLELLMQLGLLYMADKRNQQGVDIFTKVLAEDGKRWSAFRDRGDGYLNLGKHAEAIEDLTSAMELQPPTNSDEQLKKSRAGILNNLAWVLATSPEDKLRDGKRAVQLGTQACELTDYKAPHILSTLASAYAEAGDFENAMKWSSKSVEIAEDSEMKTQLGKELESYKNKKPWREAKTPGADGSDDKSADQKPTDKKADNQPSAKSPETK